MAGYIGSKSSVTQVDGYSEAEADAEFVNDPNGAITVSGSNVGIGTSSPSTQLEVKGSTYSLIRVNGSNTNNAGIDFGDTDDVDIGRIRYDNSSDAMQFWTNNSERMRIDSSGRLMLGTTAPFSGSNGSLYIETDAVVSRNLIAMNNTGSGTNAAGVVALYRRQNFTGGITNTYTSTQFNTSSDYRLKENVVDLTGASARVNQLDVKRFNFIADADTTVDGFLAHEVATVVPEAVTGTHDEVEVWKDGDELPDGVSVGDNKTDDDGNTIPVYQGIDQSKLVPLLTAALQEALTEIASLKTRVEALEA